MADPDSNLSRQRSSIGCCGAYCGTCPALQDSACRGCKLGYEDGKRDPGAARCAMKRCCLFTKKLDTCADCPDYRNCRILEAFFLKKGYKYRKYRESLDFIKENGYPAFVAATVAWKRAYGRLEHGE